MAKYNPDHNVDPIYAAAQTWRDKSLISGGSVFIDGKELLSQKLLDELDRRFVKNLDIGEGDFLSKLKVQLSEGSADCRQLMAESLWLALLFPSNVGATKKRENVLEIWSWSGTDLDATHPLLSDAVLKGVGSAETAYNTHRWRELVFLIGALRDFNARDGSEREQITSEPWAFSGWLSSLPEARHRQLIHILPHLLFPDTFERISSESDKCQILAGFGDTPEKEIKKWSTVEIDRALHELRHRLEEEHGADIDYYQEEFASQWKNQTKNWLLSWNPSRWTWDTLAADRATTISGEKADNRWRCSSSKPREGDRVFLIRTGNPPKGVVAVGKVTRAPTKRSTGNSPALTPVRRRASLTSHSTPSAMQRRTKSFLLKSCKVANPARNGTRSLPESKSRQRQPAFWSAYGRRCHRSYQAPLRRKTTPRLWMHLQRNSRQP